METMVTALLRAARVGLLCAGLLLGLGMAAAQEPARTKKAGPRAENLVLDPETFIINKHLGKAWQVEGIKPSERCTDHEFIRRVSLDIIGRIATREEIESFLADVKR